MLPEIKYQQISYTIASAGQEIIIDKETDKLYNRCTGINVVITYDTAKFSTIQLSIDNVEVFPESWEVLRVLFRGNAPHGFDYHGLNSPASGSKVKGVYKDNSNASYPYNITISLRLENIKLTDAGKID